CQIHILDACPCEFADHVVRVGRIDIRTPLAANRIAPFAVNEKLITLHRLYFLLPTTTTLLISSPIGSILMRTSSPAASVKSSGGTIPAPLNRNTPFGNGLQRPR